MKKTALIIALLAFCAVSRAQCTLPVITTPVATPDSTGTQVTITWTTSVVADSLVGYGLYNAGTLTSVTDTGGVTSHSVTVTGLIPQSSYSWGVRSQAINAGTGCGTGYYAFYGGPSSGTFSSSSPPAGTFNYGIYYLNSPTYVTQGQGVYLAPRFQTLVGTYPAGGYFLSMTLTGLPNFSSLLWTNSETPANGGIGDYDADQVCTGGTCASVPGDTLTKVEDLNQKEIYLTTNVGGTTTPGTYTVTMTGGCQTAFPACGLPVVTQTFSLTVVASTVPFSGVAFPYSTATLTHVGYPAIPDLSTYLSSANTYGQQTCQQDSSPYTGIRPNNQSTLTPVSPSTTYASWFYDGVQVYYNVRSLLNNGLNWEQCITNVKQIYRNNYAIPNSISTFMTFSHGYFSDYLAAAEPADLFVINKYNSTDTADFLHGGSVGVNYLQRETAYMARNYMHANLLGQAGGSPSNTYFTKYMMEHILGQVDEICLTQNAGYWENFMTGLQVDSLIQYYNLVSKDSRIPPAIKCLADYLYANQWQLNGDTGNFPYDKYQGLILEDSANVSGSCNILLNNMISPMYAWLFMMTGSATYQTEGDAIWTHGVLMDECQGGVNANLSWPFGDNGKNFSQQYYLGSSYVTWRSAPPVSTVPASGVSF